MLVKLLGGLAVAAGLVGAGIAGTSANSEPEKSFCCSKGCCEGCPDCKCEGSCCDNCENGCECPNKP